MSQYAVRVMNVDDSHGWGHKSIRDVERESIREFVEVVARAGVLSGRVLDYGCGRQPYREIVQSFGGLYFGYDRERLPANVSGEDLGADDWERGYFVEGGRGGRRPWDAILCTQMLQYVPAPEELLRSFQRALREGGALVLTVPTNWDEVEPSDLWRFTRAGMTHLLETVGFELERVERRAEVELGGFRFPLGYGMVARA